MAFLMRPFLNVFAFYLLFMTSIQNAAAEIPSETGGPSRVIRVTQSQFQCLLEHAANLQISKSGTVFSVEDCPPRAWLGAFPVSPARRDFITLSPTDKDCFLKAVAGETEIAVERDDNIVEVLLEPCGGKQ